MTVVYTSARTAFFSHAVYLGFCSREMPQRASVVYITVLTHVREND